MTGLHERRITDRATILTSAPLCTRSARSGGWTHGWIRSGSEELIQLCQSWDHLGGRLPRVAPRHSGQPMG